MRETSERLQDIYEAIIRIEKYTQTGREAFDQDELVQTWVIHHLEIIGEAARAIPQDYRNAHPELPWGQIRACAISSSICISELIEILFGLLSNVIFLASNLSLKYYWLRVSNISQSRTTYK